MREVEAARVRLAAKQAEKIRAALRQTYNAESIAADFLASFGPNPVTPQQARDWLRAQVRPNTKPLMEALPRLYAYAWALGNRVAVSQIARATGVRKLNKADKQPTYAQFIEALATDWNTWVPGTEAAALLLKPPAGLRAVLDSRGKTIKELDHTTLDRLGTQLSRGLAGGWTQDAVARSLNEILDDPQRAMTIASTEMSRATNIASRERYSDSQIGSVSWLVAWGEACDLCEGNADQGVTPLDEPFASGDLEPPAHPNCLCTIVPVVELDDIELADVAQLRKYSEDQERDANGRFGSSGGSSSSADFNLEYNGPDEKDGNVYSIPAKQEVAIAQAAYDQQKDQIEALTPDEKQAYGDFLSVGGYESFNEALRSGNPTAEDAAKEQALNEAIGRCSFKEDVTVYRGLIDRTGAFDNLEIGDELRDPGVVSTSFNPGVAENFAYLSLDTEETGRPIIMQISVPAGTPAASAEAYYKIATGSFTGEEDENDMMREMTGTSLGNEVTLQSNTTMTVTNILDSDNGTREIQVTIGEVDIDTILARLGLA